jgi:TRAP-type C4-dicarboxylate transport system substrate-binding protein
MRKTIKTIAIAGGTIAASLGVALAQDKVEVPVATWGSPSHINVATFVGKLTDVLKAETEGRISVRHFPSGQLAEDADMPVALTSGSVKFGWVTLNNWSGIVEDVKIADAPAGLTMTQLEEATDAENGIKAVLDRQLREKGVTLLAVTPLGPTVFVTNEPAVAPSDFAGKKIRVYSEGTAALAQAIGAAPVQLPFADVYTALQRGTIDGAITGFQGVGSQKMFEVANHVLVPASFTGAGGYQAWIANLDWWNSLADPDRDIIANAVREAEVYSRTQIIEDRKNLAAQYEQEGMTVVELTPEMPAYEAWVEATRPLMEAAEQSLSEEILQPVRQAAEKGSQ